MANLFNKYIYETYKSIVGIGQSGTSGLIPGTIQPLTDGEGNELPIRVSDTDVEVDFLTSKNLFIEAYGEVIDQNGNWVGPNSGSGSSGTSGVNGTSGTSGIAGTSGTSGANGSSGQTGSAGTSGTSGIGSSGTSGTSGAHGSSGTSGQAGSSGTSGLNGTSGANGSSGTSGISQPGTPGTSGTSGTAGTSGTSGSNGISAGQTYYFNQSQTSDVSGYKVLSPTPNGTQQIVTTNLTGSQQNAQVSQFITAQLGFGVIPGGTQRFHLHYLKPAQNDNVEAYVTIQLANSTGTPIGPVISSGLSLIGWVDASTPAEITLDLTIPTTSIDPTSRMIVKLYLNNNDSTAHAINWYTEGTQYYSFAVTTVGAIAGTSGSSGTSGVNGAQGAQGAQGANGTSGTDGSSGTSGLNGAQGAAGTSGTDGSSGTSGIGQDGTSGTSGAAGTSGTSGTSGGGGSSAIQGFFNSKYVSQVNTSIFISGQTRLFGKFVGTNTASGVNLTSGTAIALPITLENNTFFNSIYFYNRVAMAAGGTFQIALFDSKIVNSGSVDYIAPGNILINFNTTSIDLTTTGLKTITGYNTTIPNSSVNQIYFIAFLYVGTSTLSITGAQIDTGIYRIQSANATTFTQYGGIQISGQTLLTSNMIFDSSWISNNAPSIGYTNI